MRRPLILCIRSGMRSNLSRNGRDIAAFVSQSGLSLFGPPHPLAGARGWVAIPRPRPNVLDRTRRTAHERESPARPEPDGWPARPEPDPAGLESGQEQGAATVEQADRCRSSADRRSAQRTDRPSSGALRLWPQPGRAGGGPLLSSDELAVRLEGRALGGSSSSAPDQSTFDAGRVLRTRPAFIFRFPVAAAPLLASF